MQSNLSVILEKWAELYAPISHDPAKGSKKKAYYNIKAINDQSEFVRNQNTAASPCMAYSVLIDAKQQGNTIEYDHTIYFLCRAKTHTLQKSAKQDDDLGQDVQMLMDGYVQDLLAYLQQLRHTGKCPILGTTYDKNVTASLRGLDLDHAEWASIPVKYGEWHIMGLQLTQTVGRQSCVDTTKYNTTNDNK